MRMKVAALAIVLSLATLVCLRPAYAPAPSSLPAAVEKLNLLRGVDWRPVPAEPQRSRRELPARCPPVNVAPHCTIPPTAYLLY
jgi:hypothetical protein